MASKDSSTAAKVTVVGLLTLIFLLFTSSWIECPVPALMQLCCSSEVTISDKNNLDCQLSFDPVRRSLQFLKVFGSDTTDDRKLLEIYVGDESKIGGKFQGEYDHRQVHGAFEFGSLQVERLSKVKPVCYNVTETARKSPSKTVTHCASFEDAFWFGGAERYEQKWPINSGVGTARNFSAEMEFHPFISYDMGFLHEAPGSVLERYWLNSKGVALFVDRSVPLHVGLNDTHLCLRSVANDPWIETQGAWISRDPKLQYTVCIGEDIRSVHQYMAGTYWARPLGLPDERVMRDPIWTTWALYKKDINQSTVLDFARQIKSNKFPVSQIEIDDMFTSHYGDFDFDKSKFPDAKLMINTLHDLGIRVTGWIHPFMNPDSVNFNLAKKYGYLVLKDRNSTEPHMAEWWHGKAGVLDFTNERAANWYFERRKNLDDLGMDSYKFDAGESNFLMPKFATHKSIRDPNLYSTAYAEAAYKHTNIALEVRVGYQTQRLPVFVRVMDMNSLWSGGRGFNVLLPTVLHFGLVGYPFVLSDMIGGNAYQGTSPDRELFLRWTQLTAFLPSMQFSLVPWHYDLEVLEVSRRMVDLHVNYVTPLLLKWGKKAVETGDPIVRPLWWASPKDRMTFNQSTTFLIGDDVLVAPIVEKGKTSRDVYLPKGTWKDMLQNQIIKGPVTLKAYNIPITEIAYFEQIK